MSTFTDGNPPPTAYPSPQPMLPAEPMTTAELHDRDVLAAQGQPIAFYTLPPQRLRYSMASLAALERRFGSIQNVDRQLRAAADVMNNEDSPIDASAPIFTILMDALAAGLLHVIVDHPLTHQRVLLGSAPDLVRTEMNPAHLQDYVDAFARSLGEAFGSLGKAEPAPPAQTPPSPGESGTTSAWSSPTDPMTSSGE